MSSNTRAHLIITGRVQGVFFRVETQRAAQHLNVNGWVRNLPDGRVEVMIEGGTDAVKNMVDWCRYGPPLSQVDDVSVDWEDYLGDLQGFSITY